MFKEHSNPTQQDSHPSRRARALMKARLAAGAAGAAVLAGLASTAVVYGDDTDAVVLSSWWMV